MEDAGFTPIELVHLLVSHTIARSDTLVPGHQAVPFDTTPFTFDTQIFLEVLLKGVGLPFGVNSSTAGAEVLSPIPESGEMRLHWPSSPTSRSLGESPFPRLATSPSPTPNDIDS